MRTSRFERKLLLALVAVAVVPMLGAMLLGHTALREAYEVGVNPRVHRQLQRGLRVYRAHFVELKQHAQDLVRGLAWDYRLTSATEAPDVGAIGGVIEEFMSLHPTVARVAVSDSDGGLLVERRAVGESDGVRRLTLEEPIGSTGGRVTLEVVAPADLLTDYQKAGELAEVFARLEKGGGAVSNYYLLVYMGFLLSVIAIAVAVGIVLSRRVTRRIAVLAEATGQVGAGDLDVQVPTDVNDEIGELTRAFNAMVRDIRESRDRIEYLQRIGAWQEFARRLAHEIKNPLTPIQLAVQEVYRGYDGADDAFRSRLADALTIVEEEVATLRRLVSEFSDFARMPEAQLESADLGQFMRDARRSLEGIAEQYMLDDGNLAGEVRWVLPTEPLPVAIDAMMLKRGLDNLVRNALQALRDAGRPGCVELSASRDRGSAVLRISDDGPGVPESERERIFDPYVTSKSDGTGLGLAIAKKVVFEHHGEIRCETSPAGGALFAIRLPLHGQRLKSG